MGDIMTCKINADTSDGLKLESDTSGLIDIQSGGNTDFSFIANQFQTLAGSTQLDHCRPYFFAYLTAHTNVTSQTAVTKIALNAELFDSDNKYDNSTNYRFTPGVAGYYLIQAQTQCNASDAHFILNEIRKNGGGSGLNYATAFDTRNDGSSGGAYSGSANQARVIYLDTDDYVECYGAVVSASTCQFAGHDSYAGFNCYMLGIKIG